MTEGTTLDVTKKLSEAEIDWLTEQYYKIFRDKGNLFSTLQSEVVNGSKRLWIEEKYNAMENLGFAAQTIYQVIFRYVKMNGMHVSRDYIRSCIIKRSGMGLPRNALYENAWYLKTRVVKNEYIRRNK